MGKQGVVEALAAHADELSIAALPAAGNSLDIGSAQELAALSLLAARVKRAFAPVRAPIAYKRKLENDLSEVARQRMRGDVQIAGPAPRPEWIIGAAVALVGGIAYLLRSRTRSDHELSASTGPHSA
jgi:hypothetical protein